MPRTTAMPRQIVRNFGTCLNFNGTSAKAITASIWSTAVKNISMGAWFKSFNYKQNRQPIITNGSGSASNGYALELSGNATTDGSLMLLNHGIAWINLGFKIQDSNWHHIMLTIDNSNNTLVYVDGVLRFTGGDASLTTPAASSGFGSDTAGWFNGLIDDGRFYNSALSGAEVTALFYGTEPIATPINWYKFDEGSGGTANDSGSSVKNATITNATYSSDVFIIPRTLAGQRQVVRNFGTCVSLNGVSGQVTSAVWSTANTNITMSCWFKSSNYKKNRQPIISNGTSNTSQHGYAIELSGNATTDGSIMLLDHNVAWRDCSFKVQDNNWHHIVLTIDGSNNAFVYLDGVSRFTGTPTLGIPSSVSLVGSDDGGVFSGLLDEARFYTSKLTATEVTNLFYGIEPQTTPTNWYKYDEGSGTTGNDSGSAPKTATLVSATYSSDVFMIPRTLAT